MIVLSYFFRKKNPLFFSIEKVFEGISSQIASAETEWSVHQKYMPGKNGLANIWQHLKFTRANATAINHVTGDIHYIILACPARSLNILTIHDCVILKNRSKLDPKYWMFKWIWYKLPVAKADVVTVISENTKEEVIKYTGCKPEKIVVIPNFVSTRFQYATGNFNDVQPRILFVGTTPNKNLMRLAQALEGIPCLLDIVGKLSEDQLSALSHHNISYEKSERLNEDELLHKYAVCDLVAFPTTYEGFGLPILEAQATGRPILTSTLSPMKEIAGDAALLVDPYSVESIREGILQLIRNKHLREELVELGKLNVEKYKLESVAGQYARLYREAYQQKAT